MSDIQIIASDSLSLLTKAEIDVQVSTAKAFPRSLKNSLDRAVSMATLNVDIAEKCTYSLPRGGKLIEGPSIRLAEIMAGSYGNIRYGGRVIANDGKTITAQGICHDLETNTCTTKEVKRSILQHEYRDSKKTGKMIPMNDDMQVVVGNAAVSIATRNAILSIIPSVITEEVRAQAVKVAAGNAETLPVRRKKAIDFFANKGIKEAQICAVLEVKRIEDIDLEKMHILRGMVIALNDGAVSLAELFPVPEPKESKKTNKERERLMILLDDINSADELTAFLERVDLSSLPPEDAAIFSAAAAARMESLKSMKP